MLTRHKDITYEANKLMTNYCVFMYMNKCSLNASLICFCFVMIEEVRLSVNKLMSCQTTLKVINIVCNNYLPKWATTCNKRFYNHLNSNGTIHIRQTSLMQKYNIFFHIYIAYILYINVLSHHFIFIFKCNKEG